MSASWKNHERATVRVLGGRRNSRGGDFSQSKSDISHEQFSIEAKYRKSLPVLLKQGLAQAEQYDRNLIPLLVLRERYTHGSLVVLKMKDFTNLFGCLPEQSDK